MYLVSHHLLTRHDQRETLPHRSANYICIAKVKVSLKTRVNLFFFEEFGEFYFSFISNLFQLMSLLDVAKNSLALSVEPYDTCRAFSRCSRARHADSLTDWWIGSSDDG